MKKIQIIVGSQMGSAEYVADQLHEALNNLAIDNQLNENPDLNQIDTNNSIWLLCTSTHGAGEFPDNLRSFIDQLSNNDPLENLKYGVIGLGDSNYDTFNKAADDLDLLLQSLQAKRIGKILKIDAESEEMPEDLALEWLPSWLEQVKSDQV